MKKVLKHTGISLLVFALAILAYYLLGMANSTLLFTPMSVFPLFVALGLVALKYRFPYGILIFLLTPVLILLVKDLPLDPTDTRFFLLLVITFDLLFFFIAIKLVKAIFRNELVSVIGGYLLGKALTYAVLIYGVIPILPLVNYKNVVENYLWGSPLFSAAAFVCYAAALILLLKTLWKGRKSHA